MNRFILAVLGLVVVTLPSYHSFASTAGPKNVDTQRILAPSEKAYLQGSREALELLGKYVEKKNSGFGGKGIDTGAIIGGTWPWPGDDDPYILPSGVSEWVNSQLGEGENATDRATLRQLLKKASTGFVGLGREDLIGIVPQESDNDMGFFSKVFGYQDYLIMSAKNVIDTAKRLGIDTSEFSDLENMDAEKMAHELRQALSKNKRGSYVREFQIQPL